MSASLVRPGRLRHARRLLERVFVLADTHASPRSRVASTSCETKTVDDGHVNLERNARQAHLRKAPLKLISGIRTRHRTMPVDELRHDTSRKLCQLGHTRKPNRRRSRPAVRIEYHAVAAPRKASHRSATTR